MKKFQRKLKYSMWLYFLLFTVLVVGCIWIFQIFFVEGYYQNKKLKEVYNYGRSISQLTVNTSAFNEKQTNCRNSRIDVYVVDAELTACVNDASALTDEKKKLFSSILRQYRLNDGEVCRTISPDKTTSGYIYYVNTMPSEEVGVERFVILLARQEILTEVVHIIRWQFLIISIMVLGLGFILAWFIANKLTKPISEMSVTADKWAKGDESVVFEPKSKYYEIVELADALNYAKEEILKSRVLQRDLLANVSHDLRTPLTMIKAYAEMIKDISGDNKQKRDKHTKVIIDEADRLTMLVNDILNLSKLQSSVEGLDKKEINLSELTEKVIDRFSDYVENQGYKIEDYVAPNLLTCVDEQKIEQVIYNLLGNSINYTGEDKTVKVYLTAEKDKILLEIIDSGKGISEEKLATIWERYYRFSETNTRPVKGTGLGLSIVKAILDAHGITFGVRSKKDCGSNFYVEFDRIKNNE